MTPLRRFLRLTGSERGIVLEAAVALLVTWLAGRLAGFGVRRAALARGIAAVNTNPSVPAAVECAQQIARLNSATARSLFVRATCLEQSLVLCWMLRRRGMNPVLRVGARKEADHFEAHAWVELGGIVLGDAGGEEQHFVPFETAGVSLETQTH